MTRSEKQYLYFRVKSLIESGTPDNAIVQRMMNHGFVKSTIKKYIKVVNESKKEITAKESTKKQAG